MTDFVADSSSVPTTEPDHLILAQLGGGLTPFAPTGPGQLSARARWFADDDRLVLIARVAGAQPSDPDHLLAYGLAYRGDRDLWLVVPTDGVERVARRLPWIVPSVRVLGLTSDGVVREVQPMTRDESFALLQDAVVTAQATLGDRERWVAPLTDWAERAPCLKAAHRQSYLAWHCDGRQVLTIRRTKSGVRVIAGVKTDDPAFAPHRVLDLDAAMSTLGVYQAIEAVARAVVQRLDGSDVAHAEHRLQARLEPRDLGLVDWRREFPAVRPGSRRSFIDFLGVDALGVLHVVETKLGPDALLVLQGLDYWIWVSRHTEELGAVFGVTGSPRVVIDFVVGPNASGLTTSVYSAAQAESLDRSVRWRVHEATVEADGTVGVTPLPHGVVVPATMTAGDAEPPQAGDVQPRWAVRLQQHLAPKAPLPAAEPLPALPPPQHPANLLAGALPAHERIVAGELAHKYLDHPRSSQAFGLNLFAPLSTGDLTSLVREQLGLPAQTVALAEFEHSEPAERLGELKHLTQVDVLIRAVLDDGRRHAVLIEVKLSEDGFGACSAFANRGNQRRRVCRHAGPFGDDAQRCFQLTNHDHPSGVRRRYDELLGLSPGGGPSGDGLPGAGCWFRESNQVMRNVAVARSMVERGEADSATFALCAPHAHRSIWRRWHEAVDRLGDVAAVAFATLEADVVTGYHADADATWLRSRYLLGGNP